MVVAGLDQAEHPDALPNLTSGSRRVLGCPHSAVTLTTTVEPVDSGARQLDDDTVTTTTNRPESVVKQHDSIVVIFGDGQQLAAARIRVGSPTGT